MLKAYMKEVKPEDRPDIFELIEKKYKGNVDKFVDDAFAKSIYGSDANFEKFVKKPSVKAIDNDLMIRFASSGSLITRISLWLMKLISKACSKCKRGSRLIRMPILRYV